MEKEVSAGRPCSVCRSMKRHEIEDAIYSNERVSTISNRFGVSASSIYRHIRNHASQGLREAFNVTTSSDVASIAGRISDIADAARNIRHNASTDEVALKAAAMELRTLESLTARMGINHESTAAVLGEAKALAAATGVTAKSNPEVAERIIDALTEQGAEELAAALASRIE